MNVTRLKHGILGGLAGGVVFGLMMGMMGMLPMIGGMVGVPSAAAGFVVHLMISAGIGAAFGALLGPHVEEIRDAVGAGTVYGATWWLLGPLTLMPLMMGMGLGVNWSLEAARGALPSLMGHLIFGGILGFTYFRLSRQSDSRLAAGAGRAAAALVLAAALGGSVGHGALLAQEAGPAGSQRVEARSPESWDAFLVKGPDHGLQPPAVRASGNGGDLGEAGRILDEPAELGSNDLQVFEALRLVARLYDHQGKTNRALQVMLDAAGHAAQAGRPVDAAHAFVDASELAVRAGDRKAAWDAAGRAAELARLPGVADAERAAILDRIEVGPRQARGDRLDVERTRRPETRSRIFLPSYTGSGG